MIVPINIRYREQSVDFQMDIDPNSIPDMSVMHYTQQGLPCEPETCYVMLRALKLGDVAIDGGANVGFFTLLMSKLVGPTGTVLAFEPGEANLERLRLNLTLNQCQNVRVITCPLSDRSDDVPYFAYQDGGINSLWKREVGDVPTMIPATTIDYEREFVNAVPRLIKLDIEGAELKALRGASYTLYKHRPILITELNETALARAGASVAEIRDMLRRFDCFGLSTTGHFPTYIPRDVELSITRENTNVMFARMDQVRELWPEAYL